MVTPTSRHAVDAGLLDRGDARRALRRELRRLTQVRAPHRVIIMTFAALPLRRPLAIGFYCYYGTHVHAGT